MSTCIGQPVSWLQLERYRLEELPEAERRLVEGHVQQCEACGACLQRLDEPIELPRLHAVPRRVGLLQKFIERWRVISIASAAVAATAAMLLFMQPVAPGLEPPLSARLRIKGGDLALGLVREHAGSIAQDPSRFASGDRFKVLFTCPPNLAPHVDVVVFQGKQVFFPLSASQITACGNQRELPGAFTLDGNEPVTVCAIIDEVRAVDRHVLSRGGASALPAGTVCETVTPAR